MQNPKLHYFKPFEFFDHRGYGSEGFGRLRCVLTHANLQPAVACYRCQPGDSNWRALAMDVLRIEDGLITEIVMFMPDNFPAFGLPMIFNQNAIDGGHPWN